MPQVLEVAFVFGRSPGPCPGAGDWRGTDRPWPPNMEPRVPSRGRRPGPMFCVLQQIYYNILPTLSWSHDTKALGHMTQRSLVT